MTRPTAGRGLFYSRDSGGKHETTPGQYLLQAQLKAKEQGVQLSGSVAQLERMIADGRPNSGDIFFDFCVLGNLLERPGLSALMKEIEADRTVSHVFIPKRERLARPDSPHEGTVLENSIRSTGVTLVFNDRILAPLKRGHRQDIGELVTAQIEYHASGKFRDDHAEKMLAAKTALAQGGFSTGGRPPYGFRRFLISSAGVTVRELIEGERVRLAGHHVAWLPGPTQELKTIFRIIEMLEAMPASRVAKVLTDEGVPSPDANRVRTDSGVKHRVSGRWHQTTIVSIARNPLLRAMVAFGRRSMGELRRFTLNGPRHLEDEDFRVDRKPKVRQVKPENQIIVPATFEPLIPQERSSKLDEILNQRAGTQRGKPRSQDPERNPLGCRIFDMACSWRMYRAAMGGTNYSYRCGLYQQSKGQACNHNTISGPAAVKFGLEVIRQQFHDPDLRRRLQEKLEARMREHAGRTPDHEGLEEANASLLDAKSRLAKIGRNMALADTPEQHEEMKKIFEEVAKEMRTLEHRIAHLAAAPTDDTSPASKISKALALLDQLPELVARAEDEGKVTQLFQIMNLKMFLTFEQVKKTTRTVNHLAGGVVTLGAAEAPIQPYSGPTSRRDVEKALETVSKAPSSGEGDESLRNESRGDRI